MPDPPLPVLSVAICFHALVSMRVCVWGLRRRLEWEAPCSPFPGDSLAKDETWGTNFVTWMQGQGEQTKLERGTFFPRFKGRHGQVQEDLGRGEAVWQGGSVLSEDIIDCGGREVLLSVSWSVESFKELREKGQCEFIPEQT